MAKAITPEAVKAELERSAVTFGLALKQWRKSNGWAQDTAELWAKASNFVPVYNSQWSLLERGKSPQPGPLIFRSFGEMNRRLAAQDFSGNLMPAQISRLKNSKPVLHPDGTPWLASDFYGAFCGELAFPAMAQRPTIGLDQAQQITASLIHSLDQTELNHRAGTAVHTTNQAVASLIQIGARLELSLECNHLWKIRLREKSWSAASHQELIDLVNKMESRESNRHLRAA